MAGRRGLLVAVLGPDGAGKSTLVARLRADPERLFAQACVQHVRPRLFGTRDDPDPAPHARARRGTVGSLLKLAYLLADNVAGYALRTAPALRRDTLCLADRYYHDLLVDPARYGYGAAVGIARLCARLVARPDLVLVLDVPADVLCARTSELTPAQAGRLREGYRALAQALPQARVLDGSLPPELVAQQAQSLLRDCLRARDAARARAGAAAAR